MKKVLVVYYSRTGNTRLMAESVSKGVEKASAEAEIRDVKDVSPEDFLNADGIIIGSPTYYGLPAAEIKKLLDESVKYHGKLEGKAGGAFASSGILGGGAESTIMALLQAMLVHGMVIKGTSSGGHYGPVSIGSPDEKAEEECVRLGERVARLI